MLKHLLVFISFYFLSIHSIALYEEVLTATVTKTWSIEDARIEAFKDTKPFIDTTLFPRTDPNFKENKSTVGKGGGIIENRAISVYSDGTAYFVTPLCELHTFFYFPNEQLYKIDIGTSPKYTKKGICTMNFPSKSFSYLIGQEVASQFNLKSGQLSRVMIFPKPNETFVFLPNGALSSHWVGDECYTANGSSCGTRHFIKPQIPPTK